MATNPAGAEPPQQLWLDVARPIQPRPPCERRPAGRRADSGAGALATQMELRMSARPAARNVAAQVEVTPASTPIAQHAPLPVREPAVVAPRACFVTWLLAQGKSGGTIGELAKADRSFPRSGDVSAVRARFAQAGADGDAYAALEDAERAYDRAA